jgi:branched-chain amino acid transport system substrate-binding protein
MSSYRCEIRSAWRGVALCSVLLAAFAAAGCKDQGQGANGGTGGAGAAGPTATNASANAAGDTIVVGEYGSITGKEATFGKSTDAGVQLAVEEVNKAGGIKGKKVEVPVEDDQSDASKAETAVKRLIDEKHVIAVLGEVASGSSLAGGKVCQEKGVPMITPSSTKPSVTELGDYIFRVCFIDPFQAAVAARWAHDGL